MSSFFERRRPDDALEDVDDEMSDDICDAKVRLFVVDIALPLPFFGRGRPYKSASFFEAIISQAMT